MFLAKNGQEAVVYGDDKTAVHFALLNNYLGLPGVPGPEFQAAAVAQAEATGATIVCGRVESIQAGEGFTVTLEDGTTATYDYLVLP